ncbi:hypothetical protein H310_04504 [Aphanomyces invadans]|uniref:Uncharacterized protein n=1 Tax=Aphanomyces invadans TaxID=157072 RepID=A0A024UET2_9STRA|nr:hypothetical protein H310_04504 [Aphanomyces invadans]ETW04148.1 hypothetical protein H310_04504 [Aphanomyces invadans]|eukprot:XP_008867104.1 hypothetical protein H310_04504 [Aphanomyces invadans]
METIKRGWTDGDIQDELCRYALKYATNSTGNTVGELILVTHSMGNLITGGSKTSNLLEQKCTYGKSDDDALSGIFLDLVGQCPVDRAYAQLKHQSTVDATLRNQYLSAQSARANHPNKKMLCGESAFGLVTTGSVLQLVSYLSEHDTVNDGVVDFNSCSVGVGEFGTSTTSTNYKASVNHFDASFRNGDGWWGDHRKPIKWFRCVL